MAWRFRWAAPGVTIANAYVMDVVRYRSLLGSSGPPYNVVNEEQPFRPGSFLKTITVDEAEVDLTMLIQAPSSQNLWDTLSDLPILFNPRNTDANGNFGGRLLISTPKDITSKFLRCVCLSGFRYDPASLQETSVEATLSFYANYPYWLASQSQTITGNPFGNKPEWFPFFPIVLGGDAETFVDLQLTNNGDAPAFPTITITGPGDNPRITNQTQPAGLGYFPLTANGGLSLVDNTQSVVIDMFNRTVLINNDPNNSAISYLSYQGTFWTLLPGDNTVRFRIDNATADTEISITWNDTYSTIM